VRPPLLIVTADDYGLTDGVCRAIIDAHARGIVTATSVLAVGASFDYGASLLRETPALAVGAHLAAVGEDPPLLSAREIPTLVDRRGAFPLSYRTLVRRASMRRVDPDDLRREFGAQLEAIRSAGLAIGHVDTHQHVHLWPAIGDVVVELARDQGIPALRRPRSAAHGPVGRAVNLLGTRLDRRLAGSGLRATAYYAGLDEAGHLDRSALSRALLRARDAGASSVEINTHPGESGDPDLARFAWDFSWSDERELLTDPALPDTVRRLGYQLSTPEQLAMDSIR
jgi:predicted glycoside hydrolase/deacetylase ChbG (UPF0249 family)